MKTKLRFRQTMLPENPKKHQKHLKDLLNRSTEEFSQCYHAHVSDLLTEFQDIFVKQDGELGPN